MTVLARKNNVWVSVDLPWPWENNEDEDCWMSRHGLKKIELPERDTEASVVLYTKKGAPFPLLAQLWKPEDVSIASFYIESPDDFVWLLPIMNDWMQTWHLHFLNVILDEEIWRRESERRRR